MNSDNIVREVARFSNGFHNLIEELTKELDAHLALIGRLEARIIELEQKGSEHKTDGYCRTQIDKLEERVADLELKNERPKGYNMTDLGNMVDEISKEGLLDDYINERISDHPDMVNEDQVREWAKDEADDVLRNASFSVTVD